MRSLRSALVLILGLAALGACERQARRLEPAPADALYGLGADVATLGPAPPAPRGVPASEAYDLPERAYALDLALAGRAPDYVFVDGGVQPFVWRTGNDWRRFAEPVAGGYRFYYYAPDRPHPFFVRDTRFGYGFDDAGRLIGVYDPSGRRLQPGVTVGGPLSEPIDAGDLAGRYLAHAATLAAGEREARFLVNPALWRRFLPFVRRSEAAWSTAAQTMPEWRAYRSRTRGRELRRFLHQPARIRSAFGRLAPPPRPAPVPTPAPEAPPTPAAVAGRPSSALAPLPPATSETPAQ
jgi:hypothetical protein